MIDSLIQNAKPIKPDRDKILYCYNLVRDNREGVVRDEDMLGMLSYILKNNLVDDHETEVVRLSYILRETYDLDVRQLLQKYRRVGNGK